MQLSLSDNLTNNLTNSARRQAVLQAKQVAALYSEVGWTENASLPGPA